jgi:uncharacterized protein YndB with AHSA1/START domain
MSTVVEPLVVERELEIEARPETVWELLTNPDEAVRWMGTVATFDLRPGGAYRVEVIPGTTAAGAFVEVEPCRRLVYTWGWESGDPVPPGTTRVSFELVPTARGTLLRFRHDGFPSAAAAGSHASGWDHYLGRLAIAATGDDPGDDPWLERPPARGGEAS